MSLTQTQISDLYASTTPYVQYLPGQDSLPGLIGVVQKTRGDCTCARCKAINAFAASNGYYGDYGIRCLRQDLFAAAAGPVTRRGQLTQAQVNVLFATATAHVEYKGEDGFAFLIDVVELTSTDCDACPRCAAIRDFAAANGYGTSLRRLRKELRTAASGGRRLTVPRAALWAVRIGLLACGVHSFV